MELPFEPHRHSRLAVWPLAAVMALAPLARSAEKTTYVVVVSPDVPIADISLDDLRKVFRLERRFWGANQPIELVFYDSSLRSGSFLLRNLYGMDQRALKALIRQRLDSGAIDLAPKTVGDDESALSYVRAGHGLIALVRSDAVGQAPVKVLKIDGKAPDAADYPLRR